ncbi:MAG: glycosyltransferase family 2 protein [Deltaproteobacteria bacterium]
MTELTILMPCLNEAETLAACITKARGFLDRTGIVGEILIADNGSTDGSQAIAERLGARVVPVSIKGYGAALATGIEAATGRFIVMGDSDDSYDFSKLDGFVAALRNGADLVMGNRFQGGIARGAMPPLHRYLGNPVLSTIGRVLYRTPISDFHCGLRGFSRDAIIGLRLNTPGMEYASEMVFKASLAGLKIVEVPTTLAKDGRSRPPHLRSWRDGWRHLKLMLTFAPFWLFLYPGLALLIVGLPTFVALLFGPVRIFGLNFTSGTLIFASTAVITGVQMVWFHLLAHLFAVRFGLLPTSARFEAQRSRITTDLASTIGGAFVLLALIATLWAVIRWAQVGFGDLEPEKMIRIASAVSVFMALGVQSITNGFLWGLLNQNVPMLTPAPPHLAAETPNP